MCCSVSASRVGSACCSSDVHTIETFEQFYKPTANQSKVKGDFILAQNRFKNLDIANALKNSKYGNNDHVKKITKGLFCCSSMVLVERKNGEAVIKRTSDRCRRPLCPICNRIRSQKYVRRFVSAYNCPVKGQLFVGKYFYKMEFTLKHNKVDTRTGVYLNEFKEYLKKMQRSKLWKKYFPYSKKNPVSGWVNCFECTIGENGFHIHSHSLICAPRFKDKVHLIEKAFRAKWLSITGDSNGVNIDLLRLDPVSKKVISEGRTECSFLKSVIEVFKYSVKVGDIAQLAKNADDLAKYVIETKGKNMVVAKGFFRGLQLFGNKSIWDDSEENEECEEDGINSNECEYFVGRTLDLEFNKNPNQYYSKKQRKRVLKDVYLRGVKVDSATDLKNKIACVVRSGEFDQMPRSFIDITDCVHVFEKYFKMKVFESDFKLLPDWVLYCREKLGGTRAKVVCTNSEFCDQLELFNGRLEEDEASMVLEYW